MKTTPRLFRLCFLLLMNVLCLTQTSWAQSTISAEFEDGLKTQVTFEDVGPLDFPNGSFGGMFGRFQITSGNPNSSFGFVGPLGLYLNYQRFLNQKSSLVEVDFFGTPIDSRNDDFASSLSVDLDVFSAIYPFQRRYSGKTKLFFAPKMEAATIPDKDSRYKIYSFKPEVSKVRKFGFRGGWKFLKHSLETRYPVTLLPGPEAGDATLKIWSLASANLFAGLSTITFCNQAYSSPDFVSGYNTEIKELHADFIYAPFFDINGQLSKYGEIFTEEQGDASNYRDITEFRRMGFRFGGSVRVNAYNPKNRVYRYALDLAYLPGYQGSQFNISFTYSVHCWKR